MALASGCRTIKVKVGDADSIDRVAAVRASVGRDVKIRLDANASWDLDTAAIALAQMTTYDIELIEDPVADLDEMATFRRGSSVLIAAESSVRTVEDAARVARIGAADVIVLKPQRIGGATAALRAAEAAGLPAIASSALETSVGLAMVLAVAAALPDAPFAHGVGTALLLDDDLTDDPLVPIDGCLTPRRVAPSEASVG
jgi:O-succinylbenzoate synthase